MRNGFGAILSIQVKGGFDRARTTYDRCRLVTRAVSLGDIRTLITHPASTTHASMPEPARVRAGISDGLLRISVGIEDVEDLYEDLAQALAG